MNILLILEGNEEKTLYDIASKHGFNDNFKVKYINACGCGAVPMLFQSEISNDYFDAIYCLYDVDNKINEKNSPYNMVRANLKKILQDEDRVDAVSICSNPNIVQFFLLGADKLENVMLNKTGKEENTPLINKYWKEIGNKKAYDGSSWQLELIKNSFIYGPYSYDDMLENAKNLSLSYKDDVPASNLLPLLVALHDGDESFFQDAIDAKNLDKQMKRKKSK